MRLTILAPVFLLFACAPGAEKSASDPQELNDGRIGEAPASNSSGAAVTDEQGDIRFTASPEQVSAGATVLLTLANGTGEPLGYNLCTSGLETAGGSEVRTERACTMELRILEPDDSTTYSFDLPGIIEDGTYRFSTQVQRMNSGTRATVTTESIRIG